MTDWEYNLQLLKRIWRSRQCLTTKTQSLMIIQGAIQRPSLRKLIGNVQITGDKIPTALPSKLLKHTGSRNSCMLPDNAAEPACCKLLGDFPSMLQAGYKSLHRLRKEILNCLRFFEVLWLHLLSPDSNDNEQYACLAAPIADFSGRSSCILKSDCVNRFSLDSVLQDWSMFKEKEVV